MFVIGFREPRKVPPKLLPTWGRLARVDHRRAGIASPVNMSLQPAR